MTSHIIDSIDAIAPAATVASPDRLQLRKRRVTFRGSMVYAANGERPTFHLNNTLITDAHFTEVVDSAHPPDQWRREEWVFQHSMDDTSWNERGVVELEIRHGAEILARRCWRIPRRRMSQKSPLLLFLHLPKCGGTSVRVQLQSYPGVINLQALYPEEYTDCSTAHTALFVKREADVVIGHFKFGIHEHIDRPARYVTILRDPYEFVVSQYFFAKSVLRIPEFVSCDTISDAIRIAPQCFDNIMTRWLADVRDSKHVTQGDLERACHNLDAHFDYIGFTDSMPEACLAFGRYFGLPFGHEWHNQTPPSTERSQLESSDWRATIKESILYDLQLFQHAKRHTPWFDKTDSIGNGSCS